MNEGRGATHLKFAIIHHELVLMVHLKTNLTSSKMQAVTKNITSLSIISDGKERERERGRENERGAEEKMDTRIYKET